MRSYRQKAHESATVWSWTAPRPDDRKALEAFAAGGCPCFFGCPPWPVVRSCSNDNLTLPHSSETCNPKALVGPPTKAQDEQTPLLPRQDRPTPSRRRLPRGDGPELGIGHLVAQDCFRILICSSYLTRSSGESRGCAHPCPRQLLAKMPQARQNLAIFKQPRAQAL